MKNFTTIFLALFFPFFSFLNAQCFDLTTFDLALCDAFPIEITLDISGGEAPYQVNWTSEFSQGNGMVTEQSGTFSFIPPELSSSNYNFTVTDNTGCQETTSSQVLFSEPIITNLTVIEATCDGNCDGSAFLEIIGGIPPFQITVDNGITQTNTEILNLCPGVYTVIITDAIGCTVAQSFAIIEPDFLFVTLEEVRDVSCTGTADGEIDISANGGSGGYSYFWTGPNGFASTTEDLTNITAGLYMLELVDFNGCSTGISVQVSEPALLTLDYNISGLTCTDDGFIEITSVQGGTPPYTYSLNGGPTTSEDLFENLIAGTYIMEVMDAQGCFTIDTINLQSQITMQLNPTFANCDSLGGTVTITNLQGTTDASFLWSNGGVGPEIDNLAPGGYSVTVTDNVTNCVTHQNVEVLYDPACFVRISGTVLNDFTDEDCMDDSNALPAEFIPISLSNGDFTFTDSNGYYEFETSPGNYEVSVDLGNSFFDTLCLEPITVAVPNFGDTSTDNDFWVTYPGNQDLAVRVSFGAVRPGFDQTVFVYARNLGGFPMDGTVTFMHDPLQSFLDAIPAESDYDMANATLSWDFENLAPGARTRFIVDLNLPPGVALGTPLTYLATVGPEENDIDLTNNTKEVNLNVTGSYDPNDKQVTPRGDGDEGNITKADSVLTYQVRFQNTGTDTAFTVVILDKISDELDISTVRPGEASHPYRLNIIDGHTLEFRFENILLPDSFVNEPASNGFVLFDIKTKKDLPYGTTFENTAEIYFDFNEPIITNTVVNTLSNPVSVKELAITIPTQISPNPGGEESVFNYTLEQPSILDLSLYDLNGKLLHNFIHQEQKLSGTHQVHLGGTKLPKGVYFLHLRTEDGATAVRKWVKM